MVLANRSQALQEGISLALLADGSLRPVARADAGVVVESEQLTVERAEDGFEGATPKVGATDAASKQRIARKKSLVRRRKIQADAPRGVAGGMKDVS